MARWERSHSISQTRAYRIPPELKGAILKQPWSEQVLDPDTQVMIVGNRIDCYANAKADMQDWVSIDRQPGLRGAALIQQLPQLRAEEMNAAVSLPIAQKISALNVETHSAPLLTRAAMPADFRSV